MGAKPVGEAGPVGVPPAVVNSIVNAMIAQAWLASRYFLIWYVSCSALDTNSGVAGGHRLAGWYALKQISVEWMQNRGCLGFRRHCRA
jgi:hypothetical protein